jgi:hypothetical protein
MKINDIRLAAGVALFALGAPFPASAQIFSNYPVIIVPPPAQNYALPKPAPKPPPDKPKPPDTPAQAAPAPAGHYQGRTFVPN